jgi:hypothetical protein
VAKKWFIAVLLVLSLGGIIAVLYAVPMRAGEGDDAVAYIGTARNLAGGIGFYLAHNLPRAAFTHWAPMYPMILAAPAFLGMDPADSAKWINAIAFGCSIFFTGFIAWTYCRRSYMCGFLAALSILFSRDMIEIHSQALSEPPFIAFVLASMVALLSYVESEKTKHRDFGGAPDSVRGRLSFNCGLRHHSSCLAGSEATVHSFDRFCFCFDDRGPSFRRLDHP